MEVVCPNCQNLETPAYTDSDWCANCTNLTLLEQAGISNFQEPEIIEFDPESELHSVA